MNSLNSRSKICRWSLTKIKQENNYFNNYFLPSKIFPSLQEKQIRKKKITLPSSPYQKNKLEKKNQLPFPSLPEKQIRKKNITLPSLPEKQVRKKNITLPYFPYQKSKLEKKITLPPLPFQRGIHTPSREKCTPEP